MGNGFRGHGGWSDRRETRDRATAHILVTEMMVAWDGEVVAKKEK